MTTKARSRLRQRWVDWWAARLPRQDELRLTQRNLYVLPTRAGWAFAVLVSVLLLASINEQINLGYGLAFVLGGAGLAALYQTHGNLQGVHLSLGKPHSVHAGQTILAPVTLRNDHRRLGRFAVVVSTATMDRLEGGTQYADMLPSSDVCVTLEIAAPNRGLHILPRLVIETRYPLGLFRSWSYWRPQSQVLVWPAIDPLAPPLPATPAGDNDDSPALRQNRQGHDLLEGLRDHRRGDPVRWIAWKKSTLSMATGAAPITREPVASQAPERWLALDDTVNMTGLSTEQRLSRLATWLLLAEKESAAVGRAYGLRLPGRVIGCSSGQTHLRSCLDALATWQDGAGTNKEPAP